MLPEVWFIKILWMHPVTEVIVSRHNYRQGAYYVQVTNENIMYSSDVMIVSREIKLRLLRPKAKYQGSLQPLPYPFQRS